MVSLTPNILLQYINKKFHIFFLFSGIWIGSGIKNELYCGYKLLKEINRFRISLSFDNIF